MKKIGREVLFLDTSKENPRNGECTFIRLSDGRIMLAYTEYYSTCGDDHGIAHIMACTSSDEGESWSAPRLLIEKDADAQNIMSPALISVPDGTLGLFYLRKQMMPDDGLICMPCFRTSADNGETWSQECRCNIPDGYYCGINDGAIVTKSGRILYPMSHHGPRYDVYRRCTLKFEPVNEIVVMASDDCGKTWELLPGVVCSPFASTRGGFAEPGLYEHEDGTLWMWIRTGLGHQYDTLSTDGGRTWLPPEPNLRFTAPDSPMRVKKVNGLTMAIYNPVPFYVTNDRTEAWNSPKRTPFVCAVSTDDGRSFSGRGLASINGGLLEFTKSVYMLEDDPTNSFCYPAIQETKDGFLAAYYYSNGDRFCLRTTRVRKVYREELEL